jgi:hypothetical protein
MSQTQTHSHCVHFAVSADKGLPDPPPPAQGAEWVQRIISDPDLEMTKMLFIVGVLNSFDPTRRMRVMRYLNERYESD